MRSRINGVEIAYDDAGRGEAILFFHAFPLNREMWDPQVAFLSPRHRTVRFDVPGFGESAPPPDALSIERIADDGAALLDRLGIGAAVVCGCSMGGYAALAFASRHPDRLRGIVLADTRSGADSPEGRRGRHEMAVRVEREGWAAARDSMLPRLLAPATLRERPEIVATVERMIARASVEGIVAALRAMAGRPDRSGELSSIRVPALIVCGREDALTPPAESERMRAAIPGSRIALLDGAGHLANLEAAGEFNETLGAFLLEIASGA